MSKDEKVTNTYNEDSIQVLEGLEAVRKRPGMYIGTVSVRGLHHLIYEIVDNSVDEALAGFCNEINITINQDRSVVVEDNGHAEVRNLTEMLRNQKVNLHFTFQ